MIPLVASAPERRVTVPLAGQRDDELAARREVAAGRDEARPLDERECVVDGASLDDAVQVEAKRRPGGGRGGPDSRISRQRPAGTGSAGADRLDLLISSNCGRSRRRRARPRSWGRRAPAVAAAAPQRVVDRGREQRRDDHCLGGRAVQALEIGRRPEAAQCRLERLEQPFHGRLLDVARAADDDLAAHRPEPVACSRRVGRGLWRAGGLRGRDRAGVEERRSLCASWLMRDETSRPPPADVVPAPPCRHRPGWAPRASTATTPKPSAAAPSRGELHEVGPAAGRCEAGGGRRGGHVTMKALPPGSLL